MWFLYLTVLFSFSFLLIKSVITNWDSNSWQMLLLQILIFFIFYFQFSMQLLELILLYYFWSVLGRSVNTNNDGEGWHHWFIRKTNKCNLQFYVRIHLIYKESRKQPPMDCKHVSDGKIHVYKGNRQHRHKGCYILYVGCM